MSGDERPSGGSALRRTVMQSAAYLAARESGGIVLRMAGVLILTRLIGPTNYGLFAGPAAITAFIAYGATAGGDFYLLRLEHEPERRDYDQAFWVIACWSVIVTVVSIAIVPAIRVVLRDPRFIGPYVVMALITPINVLWIPAQTKLERAFRYRAMAAIELVGDVTLYAVALPLAGFFHAGVWAPVAGYVAWQTWLLIGAFAAARYRPRWSWDRKRAWHMFRNGTGFSTSSLIDRVGDLANPLIVGHFLGAAAVGVVALAIKICDVCTFVRRVLWRLSIVAFARVQQDSDRLRSAIEDAMGLQLLTVGPLLAGACFTAPWVIPFVFGHQWKASVPFLPLVAVAALGANGFLALNSVLTVRNKIASVVRLNVANFLVLFGVSAVLVPRIGINGYGVGEIAATAAAALVAHVELRRFLRFSYRSAVPWFVAAAPVMAAPWIGGPSRALVLIPAAATMLVPRARREFSRQASMVLSALLRRPVGNQDARLDDSDAIRALDVPLSPPEMP